MVNSLRKVNFKSLIIFVLFAITLLLLYRSLNKPIYQDEGVFLTISKGLIGGRLPYSDFFDHKTPGIYLLLTPVVLLFKGSIIAPHIYVLVINIISSIFIYLSSERIKKGTGLFSLVAFLFTLIFFEGNYIIAEPFIALFISISIYLTLLDKRHVLIGFLLSLAFFVKQTLVFVLVPFLLYFRRHIGKVRKILLGYLMPLIILASLILFFGFSDAFNQIVLVNFEYPREPIVKVLTGFSGAFAHTWPFWLLSIIGFYSLNKKYRLLFAGILASTIPFFFIRHYSHYWIVVLPVISLLSSIGFQSFWESRKKIASIVSIILVIVVIFSTSWYIWASENIDAPKKKDQKEAVGYINSQEAEFILCENQFTGFYYLTDKKNVSKYLYITEVTESNNAERLTIEKLKSLDNVLVAWPNNKDYAYARDLQEYIISNFRPVKSYPNLEMTIYSK